MSDTLKQELQEDLNEARRAGDRFARDVLSTTLSEIRNREIEMGEEADDEEVRAVIAKAVKQREEAARQMRDGGRPELADKEMKEAELLSEYLPPPLEEDEVRAMVREIIEGGADQIGPVMGQLMPKIRGRFEGQEANRIVREELERA
ncbi:MAG: GatB/YqeY domain-containing protein [Longimicrobiales bacterium]|nr:GatB/YqeY domain-containing protein [Longimicrobiales bacterium]